MQEVELPEVLDHLLFDRALEAEVELLQGLAGGEPGLAYARLATVAIAGGDFGLEQRLHEPLVAPLFLAGALGELGQRPGRGGRLQRAEQVRELGLLAHHAASTSRSNTHRSRICTSSPADGLPP